MARQASVKQRLMRKREEGDIMTVRKNISSDDLAVLEQYYGESPYPKRDVLEKMANELDYDIERVRNWINNRRRRDARKGVVCMRCKSFKSPLTPEQHVTSGSKHPCQDYFNFKKKIQQFHRNHCTPVNLKTEQVVEEGKQIKEEAGQVKAEVVVHASTEFSDSESNHTGTTASANESLNTTQDQKTCLSQEEPHSFASDVGQAEFLPTFNSSFQDQPALPSISNQLVMSNEASYNSAFNQACNAPYMSAHFNHSFSTQLQQCQKQYPFVYSSFQQQEQQFPINFSQNAMNNIPGGCFVATPVPQSGGSLVPVNPDNGMSYSSLGVSTHVGCGPELMPMFTAPFPAINPFAMHREDWSSSYSSNYGHYNHNQRSWAYSNSEIGANNGMHANHHA